MKILTYIRRSAWLVSLHIKPGQWWMNVIAISVGIKGPIMEQRQDFCRQCGNHADRQGKEEWINGVGIKLFILVSGPYNVP